MSDRPRVVFSTGPAPEKAPADEDAPLPETIVAKLRIEKKGRGGKTVTVVDGLPANRPFLEALARDLKRACGTGGAVSEGAVELQGDRRERLREILASKGFRVKG